MLTLDWDCVGIQSLKVGDVHLIDNLDGCGHAIADNLE